MHALKPPPSTSHSTEARLASVAEKTTDTEVLAMWASAAGDEKVTTGSARSIVTLTLADAMFPAWSVARTCSRRVPAARLLKVYPLTQAAHAPASARHSTLCRFASVAVKAIGMFPLVKIWPAVGELIATDGAIESTRTSARHPRSCRPGRRHVRRRCESPAKVRSARAGCCTG